MAQQPLIMVSTMVAWAVGAALHAGAAGRAAGHSGGGAGGGPDRRLQQLHGVPVHRAAAFACYYLVILLGTIFILQVFGEIYVGTAGGPGTSSMNLQYLTYQEGLVGTQVGLASAIGVIT